MHNYLTGWHRPSHQMTEKVVLCNPPAGLVWYCAFAKWCDVLPSSLDSVASWHLFHLAHVLCGYNFQKLSEVEEFVDFSRF